MIIMQTYDFFIEKVVPFLKGDYRDFRSKKVDGYELFVSEWGEKNRQAMITPKALAHLQFIFESFVSSVNVKEKNLSKSQISRWYVNGFTDSYNECRRYDLNHLTETTDFSLRAHKFKPKDDLEQGVWDFDKIRRYSINFGRCEGAVFYALEHTSAIDENPSSTNTMIETAFEYSFPEDVIRKLYDNFNGVIFQRITSLGDFYLILSRKPHNQKLSHCLKKKELLKKIIYELMRLLPKENQVKWLKDICLECGFSTDNIGKKINGSDSSSSETRETLQEIDEIFGKKKKKSK